MAFRERYVVKPSTLTDGQALIYDANSDSFIPAATTVGGGVPLGGILIIDSGTCPAGFVEDTTLTGVLSTVGATVRFCRKT